MGLKVRDTGNDARGWIVWPTTGAVPGSTFSAALAGNVTRVILATVVPVLTMLIVCRLAVFVGTSVNWTRAGVAPRPSFVPTPWTPRRIGLAVGRLDRQRAVSLAGTVGENVTGTVMTSAFSHLPRQRQRGSDLERCTCGDGADRYGPGCGDCHASGRRRYPPWRCPDRCS